jgi:hypothetical protein
LISGVSNVFQTPALLLSVLNYRHEGKPVSEGALWPESLFSSSVLRRCVDASVPTPSSRPPYLWKGCWLRENAKIGCQRRFMVKPQSHSKGVCSSSVNSSSRRRAIACLAVVYWRVVFPWELQEIARTFRLANSPVTKRRAELEFWERPAAGWARGISTCASRALARAIMDF